MLKQFATIWVLLLSLTTTSGAVDHWQVSAGAVVVSSAADMTSSWGGLEANRLLRGRQGRFGMRGLIIKSAMTGGIIGVEYLILRKRPQWRRKIVLWNWVLSGVSVGVAVRNFKVRRK